MKNDWDDSDEFSATYPCSHCGREVYEDAEQCPYCGMYITFDTSPWSGRPTWWIVLGILGIFAVVVALAFA